MKINKKILILFLALALLMPAVVLGIPIDGQGQSNCSGGAGGTQFSTTEQPCLPSSLTNLWNAVVRILNFVWPVFVGFAILMFLVSGFLFLSSQGEAGKLKLAKDSLIFGIIGVIVGLLSFSLPYILGNTLGI